MVCEDWHKLTDNDSIGNSSWYLCLAGAGVDVSGCVNAGDDEASRSTSEDVPDSLLLFLPLLRFHYPLLLLRLPHFLPSLAPSLFLALCPQRPAKQLCPAPSPVPSLRSCHARMRQGSVWELDKSRVEQQGQEVVAHERTGS